MARNWKELTKMTGGEPLIVEKVRLANSDISIEGDFELPAMARLTMEDQIFVAAFVRSHGSIKEMERIFGVSYPTIKNRLNRIAGPLDFVEVKSLPPQDDILDRLEHEEISVSEALELIKKREQNKKQ